MADVKNYWITRVQRPGKARFFATNQFKMQWDHFRAVERQPTVNGEKVHAAVGVQFDLGFSGSEVRIVRLKDGRWRLAEFQVRLTMIPSLSPAWLVYIRRQSSNAQRLLLQHERVHLEIHERYARGLAIDIQSLRSKRTTEGEAGVELATAASQLLEERRAKSDRYNKYYDKETDHGRRGQKVWNRRFLVKEGTNSTLR